MKKILKSALLVFMAILMLFPATAFAEEDTEAPEWEDVVITEEELDEMFGSISPEEPVSPAATGLITNHSLSISRDSRNLYIYANTKCTSKVVKCGYKEVVIQRRVKGTTSWSTYKKYTDLYKESTSYALTKSIAISSGYQFRVTCKHYAKKNLLSTQTISSTSNIVTYS